MHSMKNISERNKIDTQSRADTYIRRKRLISKSDYNFKVWIHLKVFVKLKKPSLLGKKTQKTPKNPLGWVKKKPGFFQTCLQEELKIKRNLAVYHDSRVHVCLYFICPTGHGLKSIDLVCMKKLDQKVSE